MEEEGVSVCGASVVIDGWVVEGLELLGDCDGDSETGGTVITGTGADETEDGPIADSDAVPLSAFEFLFNVAATATRTTAPIKRAVAIIIAALSHWGELESQSGTQLRR